MPFQFNDPSEMTPAREKEVVEHEVALFESYFVAQGNQALVGQEKALLRTYLLTRVRGLLPA